MTGPGAPRRGRHASPEDDGALPPTSWIPAPARSRDDGAAEHGDAGRREWAVPSEWALSRPEVPSSPWTQQVPDAGAWRSDRERVGVTTAERACTGGAAPALPPVPRPAAGLLERRDGVGLVGMPESRHRSAGEGDTGRQRSLPDLDGPRPAGDHGVAAGSGAAASGSGAAGAPLPPMPPSAWSKMRARTDDPAATGPTGDDTLAGDPASDWDRTGGLEVIGAHVDEASSHDEHGDTDVHERWVDDDSADAEHPDEHEQGLHEHVLGGHGVGGHDDDVAGADDGIPVEPFDRGRRRTRRRRRRIALLVSLIVMAGLVAGVFIGGQKVLDLINPPDYTGQGTGSVHIRVAEGDSLKAIGRTMVAQGVIASVRPFTDAAANDPDAASVSPGLYGLRKHMSSKAALALLLDPKSRLVSRVTVPEGLTVVQTLQRVAQNTGTPLAQLQAAAADPAALGLPAYAGGKLEGFLFPATYDFEPGTTPVQMLSAMVTRGQQALDALAIPRQQRLNDLTEASIVQAEASSVDDMAKVARVLDNRLAVGMPLQLDTTVNYANGKAGLTTTDQDRANPSPYNTYLHAGLPPGPISNPGEQALRAVLAPAQGQWLYFVVVNPDTGETRFATTAEEHMQNVKLFQQWLQQHPGR